MRKVDYTGSNMGIRNLDLTIEALQKPCLLETARIIRKYVLDVK